MFINPEKLSRYNFLYILLGKNVAKSELYDNNIVDVSCILYFYEQKIIFMKNV